MSARSVRVALCGPVCLVVGLVGCGSKPAAQQTTQDSTSPFAQALEQISNEPGKPRASAVPVAPSPAETGCSQFVDVAEARRLQHIYENGAQGLNLMVEATGGGCGWLDYDGDGFWDLFLNQAGDPGATDVSTQPRDKLFRSLMAGEFQDVTILARIDEPWYAQGLAVGDYDADGFDDIYVTNVGRNSLFRNLGDGTFEDQTVEAGVQEERWSSSAAWADLDQDGLLDLYVCNYCDYDPHDPKICQRNGVPRICHPKDVPPAADEFYRNRGDGTFVAESAQRGLYGPQNRALGIAVADFDDDGDPDLYVANDTTANFLFENDGRGVFAEVGALRGCAVDRNGATQASMGVACGDYDEDGWLDLYSTHFHRESNTLYRNLAGKGFEDVTGITGLHLPTMPYLAFGTVMADFDQDGRQELFVANGHIEPHQTTDGQLYEMEAQHFEYDGVGHFHECSHSSGPYFSLKRLGRGVASCDYDRDGDLDLCVVNQNAPLALLENQSVRGHWLEIRLIGVRGDRRGVGSRLKLRQADRVLVQQLCGGTSFAAAHQPVLLFGLGDNSSPCSLEVTWPGGQVDLLEDLAVDQHVLVMEGRGKQ